VRWARPAQLPDPAARLVVVEASAGTGKTFFLEHRLADLIVAGGATLDQVLVVTFTEKATRELRGRIRELLGAIAAARADTAAPGAPAWIIDDAVRARLDDAAVAFDRAPIHTIHGFCQRILVEDAFAGRRLFDQTQVPDEAAFDDAFYAVLRERYARDPADLPALAAWLRSGRSVERLRTLLLGCLRADAPIAPAFAADAFTAAVAAARAAWTAAGPAADWLGSLGLHGSTVKAAHGWLAPVERAVAGDARDAFDTLARLDAARTSKNEPVLLGLSDKVLPAMRKARVPAIAELGAALARLAALGAFDAAIASHLLPPVLDRIGADKAERGQFDYQDMLRLVHAVLVDPERGPALAARLRRRHPWALIDEFQDTDPVQWEIFRRVWAAPAAPDGVPGGLMIVGDPKQAIYGFRGADVHTYLRAREELRAAGATEVVLGVNRRSTPELVEAVNALLVPGPLQEPFFTGGIAYDRPVTAAGDVVAPDLGAPVRVLELAAPNGDGLAALRARIGDEIEALLAGCPPWQRAGVPQPITLADIMVLTRSNRESAEMSRALRERGLPCTLLQAEQLFEQIEASDLADLLDAIAAPRDRSRRLRAWATAFFAVPWDGLGVLAGAPDDHPLVEPLFAWSAIAQRRDYERLFARILDDTRYAERALLDPGGERAIANTLQVIELLVAEVSRARGEIHELVRRLRRWIADGGMDRPDDRDVQRIETDADAVQVMTIHRAKGLEAPIVFLYGGTSAGGGQRQVQTFHDGAARAVAVGKLDDELGRKVKDSDAAENQRLAYVALTRAQVRLYLPRYPKLKDGVMYRAIDAALARVAARGQAAGFAFEPVVTPAPPAPPPDDALVDLIPPPPPPAAPPALVLEPARTGRAIVSYSRLAHRAAGGAEAIDLDELERDGDAGPAVVLPPDELPGGIATGLFVHEVLEHVDPAAAAAEPDPQRWARAPEVERVFRAAAHRHAIDERHLAHARRIVHRTLTTPLDLGDELALPALAQARDVAREIEFVYPIGRGAPGAGLVRGVIDLLVRWDDRLWIADYKTDILTAPTRAAARVRIRERYEIQARLYGLAAARLVPPAQIGGLLYWFVRDHVVVALPCGADELAAWQGWLEQVEVAA
jgi:exodeoxyribonuclease V beta subunit